MIANYDASAIVPALMKKKSIRCNFTVKFMRTKQAYRDIA